MSSHRKIFLDTNIFLYARGKGHPYKNPCARLILAIADGSFAREWGAPAVDSEVFQEILYFYSQRGNPRSGLEVCRDLLVFNLEIFPIGSLEVERMIELGEKYLGKGLPPRDLIHAAAMLTHGIENIISADTHFDIIEGIRRLDPAHPIPSFRT